MVAASSPLATQAGLRVLADGGNAVDAALATAAVVGVVEPMMNGLGGDMWAMVWWEDEQRVYGLNASGRCPEGLTAGLFAGRKTMPQAGWETVTVPGACDGYSVLHERFATRPLSELVAPAVGFARDGFPVGESRLLPQASRRRRHLAVRATRGALGHVRETWQAPVVDDPTPFACLGAP